MSNIEDGVNEQSLFLHRIEQNAKTLLDFMCGPEPRISYARDMEAMRRRKWRHITTPICDNYDNLTDRQKATVQRHLQYCGWCRSLFAQLQWFKEAGQSGTTDTAHTA